MDEAVAGASYSLPPPEAIRQTAQDIISRPAYDLESGGDTAFLVSLARWFFDLLRRILAPIGDAIQAVFDLSPILGWVLIVTLLAIAVALITHITYTFVRALRGRRRPSAFPEPEQAGDQIPETWEQKAQEAFARADLIGAVRCLFRACLLRLERARKRTVRRGATNREYLRRFRNTPAFEPLCRFVDVIDAKWYGRAACSSEDFRQCEEAHARIRRAAEEMTNAHGA